MCIIKKIFRLNKNEINSYIKVTENGSLYVDIKDLIKQEEFKKIIEDLKNSEIIKTIDKNKQMNLKQ